MTQNSCISIKTRCVSETQIPLMMVKYMYAPISKKKIFDLGGHTCLRYKMKELLVFYWSILAPIGFKMHLQAGAFLRSIPYNIDSVVRFEFLRNRAQGTCEGVLTVRHVTTIGNNVQVVRQGHVVISSFLKHLTHFCLQNEIGSVQLT